MLNSVVLRVEAIEGRDVRDVIQEMVTLTTLYPLVILQLVCRVNGITIIAKNGDTVDRLIDAYSHAFDHSLTVAESGDTQEPA